MRPAMFVSANARFSHWGQRHRVHAYWRELAAWRFREVWRGRPPLERVRVVVTFHFPDRRRRDPGNYYSHVVKPIVDGMVDAGLVPDDSGEYVVGPDPRQGHVAPAPGKFVVRVEEVS